MSCHDTVSADGRVHDPNRIDFLDRYLGALQKAIADGADVRGYFVWSFLDLYEWEKGYTERFGLVYTDFVTQKRLVKDSAYWYKGVIDSRGQSLSINQPLREILYFTPEVKNLVWGKEEWTISAHEHGDVRVREGSFAGMSLSQLWQTHPEIFGGGQDTEDGVPCITNQRSGFPLLVKIITANEDLSIQVHPDDEYARQNENGANGKTECWYILDCEPDTKLVLGHNAGNHDELKNMITENRFDELIREVPIKPGDFIQIEPGTVHAIKGGTRLLEIQQSSDITYRLYDYGRVVEGKSRPLHLRQALEVIKNPCVAGMPSGREEHGAPLISCDYYTVWELEVSGTVSYIQDNDYSFLIVCVIEGDGLIDGQQIRAGDHFILPYGYGKAELMGEMRLVLARAGSANCAS
jgi:beta-glucosidase